MEKGFARLVRVPVQPAATVLGNIRYSTGWRENFECLCLVGYFVDIIT